MTPNINVTITMQDGEKPVFHVDAGFDDKLIQFNLDVIEQGGKTTITPDAKFEFKNAVVHLRKNPG